MMSTILERQEEIQYIKEQVLAKFPLLGVTMRPLSVVADDKIGTAATDGHRIIYSPKFFSTLSDEQKQFVFAHEVMHVAFNHILRSKGRNQRLWNIATDSVINQILKNEKLPMTDGGVDIAEAVNHSAEEMYEKLLKKKEQHDQEKEQKQEQQQSQSGGADQPQDQDEQNQQGKSDHQSDSSKNQDGQDGNPSENSDASKQQKDQSKEGDSNSDGNSSSEQNNSSGQSSENQQGSTQVQKGQSSRSDSGSGSENTDWDDSNIDWDSEDEQVGHDTHDIWKEAVEQAEREEQREQEQSKKKNWWDKVKEAISQQGTDENQEVQPQENEVPAPKDEKIDAYEKGFVTENQEKRHEMAEQVREHLNRVKGNLHQPNDHTTLGAVGETQKPVADWKKLLKESFDEERDRWSYRRSSAENDYMARVEELEDEARPDTEVMLDVSGSVNIRLLREFLRQLKPLLKSSKLKVGCFDTRFHGFQEIKSAIDIDSLQVSGGGGTDLNVPVAFFTPKKEVNKIVFTDGYGCCTDLPPSPKQRNVIWLVYGNKDFNPCCGKVIQVSKQQFQSYIHTAPLSRGGR